MMDLVWAFIKGSRNTIIPIVTGVIGFLIGLIVFGWYLTPVEYVGATAESLRREDAMQFYLRSVASAYAVDNNVDFANSALWTGAEGELCNAIRWAESGYTNSAGGQVPADQNAAARLRTLLQATSPGIDCNNVPDVTVEDNSGLNPRQLGLLLAAILLIGIFLVLWQRRFGGEVDVDAVFAPSRPNVLPTEDVVLSNDGDGESGASTSEVIPIASYRTDFAYGNDVFDQSFQIENANGDFLGECGVDISESIGNESPKHVTAIEVWLFDKQDIRTITKVAMSDHAYFDEVLRAKLATKGEQVLARTNEVVVLETAALIINAKITDLAYGDDPGYPNQSYFDRFSVEISAWAKGDSAGPTGGNDFDFGEDFYS